MWILFAFGSAFFAGITSILAKCGIKKADSTVATAIRTVVVLAMSALMVAIVGSFGSIAKISARTWIFLVLSGLSTGASWLCYFRALQLGEINRVVPIDKSSTVLTMLLAFIILGEPMTWLDAVCIIMIGAGTLLMIEKKPSSGEPHRGHSWLIFACLSALFAALTSIFGKLGIEGVESNLGTMLRTAVVLLASWSMVLITRKGGEVRRIPRAELGFICLSGLATGASWLCYYKALRDGPASVVVPIDKLSILVTVAFSCIVFREKLTARSVSGLVLIVAGTLLLLV